jgi:hypothetical protein
MANVGPATATITSTTGPGQSVTATVFNRVTNVEVDFMKNTLKVTHADGLTITYFDYSAITTMTWTISAGASTLTIS